MEITETKRDCYFRNAFLNLENLLVSVYIVLKGMLSGIVGNLKEVLLYFHNFLCHLKIL